MKTYLITIVLLLSSLVSFCQQETEPVVTDTPMLDEPVLIDTTSLPPSSIAVDTPSIQLQPNISDTLAMPTESVLKAQAPEEPTPINLNMERGRINVRAGGYYLAGGIPAMGIGALLVALSHTIKVAEPQTMRITGYAFISIGGVFSITGLGHIIHGKRLMREAKK